MAFFISDRMSQVELMHPNKEAHCVEIGNELHAEIMVDNALGYIRIEAHMTCLLMYILLNRVRQQDIYDED